MEYALQKEAHMSITWLIKLLRRFRIKLKRNKRISTLSLFKSKPIFGFL